MTPLVFEAFEEVLLERAGRSTCVLNSVSHLRTLSFLRIQRTAYIEQVRALVGVVFLLVHLIASPPAFPLSTRHSPAYATMLLAWSVTEVIRYSYFVFSLSGLGVPKLWTWLRYNTFLVLYPLGIASECWLVYSAIPLAKERNEMFAYALWAILAVYVPGSYILFSHMLAQRRKIARQNKRV